MPQIMNRSKRKIFTPCTHSFGPTELPKNTVRKTVNDRNTGLRSSNASEVLHLVVAPLLSKLNLTNTKKPLFIPQNSGFDKLLVIYSCDAIGYQCVNRRHRAQHTLTRYIATLIILADCVQTFYDGFFEMASTGVLCLSTPCNFSVHIVAVRLR